MNFQFILLVISFTTCFGCQNFNISDGLSWDCSRPWPRLELFLPIIVSPENNDAHGVNSMLRNSEWLNIFLRSFMLFWPVKISNTNINLIVDAEVKERETTTRLLDQYVYSQISTFSKVNIFVVLSCAPLSCLSFV